MGDLVVGVAEDGFEWMEIAKIRRSVFQVEQGVDPGLDFDGHDDFCDQIIACLDGQVVGTARVRFLDAETAKIERLAVLSGARGNGVGKMIMIKALDVVAQKKLKKVVVNAQVYVKGLYLQLGFEQVGECFEEAGITHVKMRKILE